MSLIATQIDNSCAATISASTIPRVNILGVGISALNMDRAVSVIDQWIFNGERHYACITSVHGVIESQYDENLRRIHNNAGMVTPDGMPLVWVSRLMGSCQTERVYGPDLMLAVCAHAEKRGFRNFLWWRTGSSGAFD